MKPPALQSEGLLSGVEGDPGLVSPAGVTPLADNAGAKTTVGKDGLPSEAATWRGSACTAAAVVGFVAVLGTDGGVIIAAAAISREPGSHALRPKSLLMSKPSCSIMGCESSAHPSTRQT